MQARCSVITFIQRKCMLMSTNSHNKECSAECSCVGGDFSLHATIFTILMNYLVDKTPQDCIEAGDSLTLTTALGRHWQRHWMVLPQADLEMQKPLLITMSSCCGRASNADQLRGICESHPASLGTILMLCICTALVHTLDCNDIFPETFYRFVTLAGA